MNKNLLSVQEAAKILKITVKTLHRYEKRGILIPQRTDGNHRRYIVKQIEQFKQNREKKAFSFNNNIQENILTTKNLIKSSSFSLKKPLNVILEFLNIIDAPRKRILIGFLSLFFVLILTNILSKAGIVQGLKGLKGIGERNQQELIDQNISDNNIVSQYQSNKTVLGESTVKPSFVFNVGVPSLFKEDVDFSKELKVQGKAVFLGGVATGNKDLDLGSGKLTASNVLYSLKAGDGLSVTTGQTPTIANAGVLSLGGSTGALTLKAGTGISISGLTITNSSLGTDINTFKTIKVGSDSFSASSNTDTLEFAAGTGITITTDTSNKKLTLAGSLTSGFTDDGTVVRLTTSTDSVGIGTTSPSQKLDVVGNVNISSGYTFKINTTDVLSSTTLGSGVVTSSLTTVGALASGSIASGFGTISTGNTITTSGTMGTAATTTFTGAGGTFTSLTNSGAYTQSGTSANTFTSTSTFSNATYSALFTGGNVGIGTTSPLSKLQVAGDITPEATGTRNLGSSSLYWNNAYINNIISPASGTSGYWQRNNQALSPTNITDDLLLGATATSSAKFGIINMAGGNPTATMSSNLSLIVPTGSGYASSLNLLNNGSLNIKTSVGGDAGLATAFFISNLGNIGIGTTSPSNLLSVGSTSQFQVNSSGNVTFASTLTPTSNFTLGSASYTGTLTTSDWAISSTGALTGITGITNDGGYTQTGTSANTFTGTPTFSNATYSALFTGGNVGIGTTAPSASLEVAGAALIAPASGSSTALTVKAAPSGSNNIFSVQNNAGTSTYFSVDSSGSLSGSAFQITDASNAVVGTAIEGGWTLDSNTYTYRRAITVTNNDTSNSMPTNMEITVALNSSDSNQVYTKSQQSSPYKDFRIGYYNGSTYTEIGRVVSSFTSSNVTFIFKLQAAISASSSSSSSYYIYYRNTTLATTPSTFTSVPDVTLDNGDTVGNWTSSDNTNYTLSQETTTYYTSTGSVKQVSAATPTQGDINTFSTTSQAQLPQALKVFSYSTTATIGGTTYVYLLGGNNGSQVSTVYKSQINTTTGDMGAFSTTSQAQLPQKFEGEMAVISSTGGTNYIYVMGGDTTGTANNVSTVYKSQINTTTGDAGTFATTSQGQLIKTLHGGYTTTASVGGTNYVYVMGGWDSTYSSSVYKSQINTTTGDAGTFATTSQGQMPTAMSAISANTVSIGGTSYIYIIGGWPASSTVYKSQINTTTGDAGTFATTSQGQLPVAIGTHASITVSIGGTNYLYVIGGVNGPGTRQSAVYKATIGSTGNVGTFSTTSQAQLPQALRDTSAFTATIGGTNYIYVIGGNNGSPVSTVYKATINGVPAAYTSTKTISSTDLSNKNYITWNFYSSRTGSYMAFEFSEDGSTWQTCNFSVSSASTWETKSCDISAIASGSRDGVTQIRFKVTDNSSAFTAYFDNLMTSTVNFGGLTSSSSNASAVLGANNLAINAQGTGLVQVNYAASTSPQAGSGGLTVYNGGTTALFTVGSTGAASIAALSAATSTALTIGALTGTTADTGISIGAISGSGATGTGIIIGNISTTGTTNNGIQLGTLTGGTTSNYQINAGNITAVASATNAGINLGTISGTAASSSNYGIKVGAISSTGTLNTGLDIGAISGAATTNTGVNIGNISAATGNNYGINIGTLTGGTGSSVYGINTGTLTSIASGTNFQANLGAVVGASSATFGGIQTGAISGAGTTSYGLNLGANSSTATTNYGINIGAISGAGTTNYGLYIGNLSGATTSKSIFVGTNSSATATGLDIGALSGGTANIGINIGGISGTGTASYLTTGTNSATGATAYQLNLGAISGANATSHTGINVGNISGTTAAAAGITLGTLTGGTSTNYQISTGTLTGIASATNAQLNLGTSVGASSATTYGINVGAISGAGTTSYGINLGANTSTATTNYGMNIGAISGAGTNNYGLYVGVVSGASNNYAAIFAGGNVGIGTTSPSQKLDVAGNLNISSGSTFKINGTDILSGTTLGSGVVTSSLTTVGILASGSIASGFGNISTANTITTSGTMGTAAATTFTGAGGTFTSLANSGAYTQTGTSANTFTGTPTFSNATYSALFTGGNVGIGTTIPLFKVDLIDSQAATVSALITNSNTGLDADVLALKIGSTSSPATSNRFLTFLDGNGVIVGSVQGNGSGGVTYATTGIDFAEYYRISTSANLHKDMLTGSLVCLSGDGVLPCDKNNKNILGIISDRPGFVGGSEHQNDQNYVLVGLTGQLPVKISTESGVIKQGDPLTVSSISGAATKQQKTGTIVGRALEGYDPQNPKDKILVSINISWYDQSIVIGADGNLLSSTLGENIDNQSTTPVLNNSVSSFGNAETILGERINKLEASYSAQLSSTNSNLFVFIEKIKKQEENIASFSSQLASLKNFEKLTLIPISNVITSSSAALRINDSAATQNRDNSVTIANNLTVFGGTALGAVAATDLTIGRTLSISGNSIDVIGQDFNIQAFKQGGVSFLSGLVKIDVEGNVQIQGNAVFAQDVAVKGVLSAKSISLPKDKNYLDLNNKESISSSSAGTSFITIGETQRKIHNPFVRANSLIYITPEDDTENQILFISEKKEDNYFIVSIKNSAVKNLKFNFLIINNN